MVEFKKIPANSVSDDLLAECRALFRANYGRWSDRGSRPGEPIDLPLSKLREYIGGDRGWIATARVDSALIGYAMVVAVPCSQGTISWVTQFVVDAKHQNKLVGSRILHSAWISSHYAWGIASANPYAIRALEKATRRRCEPSYIKERTATVRKALSVVPYLRDGTLTLNPRKSVIDTQFYQDLSSVDGRLRNASQKEKWRLGSIDEGQEWLAVTFREQAPIRWTDEEFENFTQTSFEIAQQAYERMAATNPQESHPWARLEYAEKEVKFLESFTQLPPNSEVLDFGCGSGRHSWSFAQRGHNVVGVDFSKTAIKRANAESPSANATFISADCRFVDLGRQFDLGVCLYDVIGSFPDDVANEAILRNLIAHVRPGGHVAISVMSFDYTRKVAENIATSSDIQDRLADIPPSKIMQESGNVFDPKFFLLDVKSRLEYPF